MKFFNNKTIKIGTVKFLNAKPLDYGFFYPQNKKILSQYQYKISQDVPSKLIESLLKQEIHIGLISSIEALRNKSILDYYPNLGICSKNKVQSIFYITKQPYYEPVKRIFLDLSSRSSVALLKILYFKTFNQLPEFIFEKPETIVKKIDKENGGLLIGDPAIKLFLNQNTFYLKDLSEWWYEQTQLPFVYAVWTYPKNFDFDKTIFEESYNYGISSLDQIIKLYDFPKEFTYQYLTKNLHYRIGEQERKSLKLYEEFLKELDLF
jgi:chorismate dehydratase